MTREEIMEQFTVGDKVRLKTTYNVVCEGYIKKFDEQIITVAGTKTRGAAMYKLIESIEKQEEPSTKPYIEQEDDTNKKKFKFTLYIEFISFCILSLFFSNCHKKDEGPRLKTRTVIVYMVGDNTLNPYVDIDINEMERGWKDSFDGDLIVYVDQKRVAPYILKISADRTDAVVSEEVMKYSEQNSSSVDVMDKVLADIKDMYPAKSYGLILWSHASGWLPGSLNTTRVFGDDNGEYMEISELAKLSGKYDFFIFDACDMMGVEVVYELRNNADYIVGSVTEIMGDGFPYINIIEYLFEEDANLISVCEKFMDFTPSILNIFEIKKSCGLSCYIPGQHSGFDYSYKNMAWYKATYGN
ncbi:MAG: hypothetical protein LBS43_03620 [Prevotellaceae bacterium]|nr:hypothetical protein [Prevotellaceae bacterium]